MYFWQLNELGRIGWLICLVYVICVALRLARYNITSSNELSWRDHFFEGIPSPAGGILVLMPLIYSLSDIPNIPLNKWINVMIRVQGKIVDVFINGAISKRHVLQQVVRQNYGDTYVLENQGFDGEISNLIYFNHALNVSEILDIVNSGPNLTQLGDGGAASFPPYFALRWYFMSNDANQPK